MAGIDKRTSLQDLIIIWNPRESFIVLAFISDGFIKKCVLWCFSQPVDIFIFLWLANGPNKLECFIKQYLIGLSGGKHSSLMGPVKRSEVKCSVVKMVHVSLSSWPPSLPKRPSLGHDMPFVALLLVMWQLPEALFTTLYFLRYLPTGLQMFVLVKHF